MMRVINKLWEFVCFINFSFVPKFRSMCIINSKQKKSLNLNVRSTHKHLHTFSYKFVYLCMISALGFLFFVDNKDKAAQQYNSLLLYFIRYIKFHMNLFFTVLLLSLQKYRLFYYFWFHSFFFSTSPLWLFNINKKMTRRYLKHLTLIAIKKDTQMSRHNV